MSLTFSIPDEVLATTLAKYSPKLSDNVFKSTALLSKLMQKGNKEMVDGGESLVEPLMYDVNSTFDWYSGYGIIDTTPQAGITAAKYNWKQLGGTITISGKEARQNSGSSQIVNLLKGKVKQAEQSMKKKLAEGLYYASASDSGSEMHSIATIVSASGTVGGIAKGSYAWWQSQSGTAASFAANGLDEMRNIFNDCTVQDQTDHPDIIMTDQTNFERYEKVLQPQERFQDSKMADGGFQNLLFKGVPLSWDYYCTAGKMYFLNTNYLKLKVHKEADMKFGEFQEPENQDAKVAKLIWMGELVASNCQKHGVLTISAA